MADLLSIGVSGLRAFQRALDVTGHNIANSTTPGYSRQSVSLATRPAEAFGNGYLGTGVNIVTIGRTYDELLGTQFRDAQSSASRLDIYASNAQSLNNLFADSSTGMSVSIQRFMNAVQGVSNDPGSTAARQVLLSEADGLRQRLQTYDRRLDDLNTETNARIGGEAAAITSLAESIARLNQQIVTAQTSGQAPNDLLDARDRALGELSSHLSVSVVKQDDGAWNVFVGNGQSLVLGGNAAKLVAQRDPFDPGRMTIAYQAGTTTVDMSSTVSGGTLGGLLDFRREMLDPVRSQLGQIAVGLVSLANAQHQAGMDLQGNMGGELFGIGAPAVLPHASNGGGSLVPLSRDPGALTGADYILQFDGTDWSARRADTGAAATLTGTGAPGDPLVVDGLRFEVGNAPAAGDRFLVKSTSTAIAGMSVQVSDPAKVAAAAPIRTATGAGNSGSATISPGEVLDATDPLLRTTVTIEFLDDTSYTVNGGPDVFTYTPGDDIDINGWRVAISGAPAAGDTFTVANNAGGVGDNRNMLALSDMLGRGVFSAGSESVNAAVSRFVGDIGVRTNQAQAGADAQQIILRDTQVAVDSVSGVNLDEEAANMLRYQQAYMAAAQVIRATQDMFDALLRATSR